MAYTEGAATLAERPTDSLWMAALPTAVRDLLPARPAAVPAVRPAQGRLGELSGAITDMAVSPDGRHLVAAHRATDTVSVIDVATLTLRAAVEVAEPGVVVVADRAYVGSAAAEGDRVVAVDLASGAVLGAREVGLSIAGMAVSPGGELLYLARRGEERSDIAVVDVESGATTTIPVSRAAEASLDALRIDAEGSRLYGALRTPCAGLLVGADPHAERVVNTVTLGASVGDIAVHGDGRRIFATGWKSGLGGVLTVADAQTGRVIDTVAAGGLSLQLVLGGDRVYLAADDRVIVLDADTRRVLDRFDIGGPVSCVALSADHSCLYVAGYDGTLTARAAR